MPESTKLPGRCLSFDHSTRDATAGGRCCRRKAAALAGMRKPAWKSISWGWWIVALRSGMAAGFGKERHGINGRNVTILANAARVSFTVETTVLPSFARQRASSNLGRFSIGLSRMLPLQKTKRCRVIFVICLVDASGGFVQRKHSWNHARLA